MIDEMNQKYEFAVEKEQLKNSNINRIRNTKEKQRMHLNHCRNYTINNQQEKWQINENHLFETEEEDGQEDEEDWNSNIHPMYYTQNHPANHKNDIQFQGKADQLKTRMQHPQYLGSTNGGMASTIKRNAGKENQVFMQEKTQQITWQSNPISRKRFSDESSLRILQQLKLQTSQKVEEFLQGRKPKSNIQKVASSMISKEYPQINAQYQKEYYLHSSQDQQHLQKHECSQYQSQESQSFQQLSQKQQLESYQQFQQPQENCCDGEQGCAICARRREKSSQTIDKRKLIENKKQFLNKYRISDTRKEYSSYRDQRIDQRRLSLQTSQVVEPFQFATSNLWKEKTQNTTGNLKNFKFINTKHRRAQSLVGQSMWQRTLEAEGEGENDKSRELKWQSKSDAWLSQALDIARSRSEEKKGLDSLTKERGQKEAQRQEEKEILKIRKDTINRLLFLDGMQKLEVSLPKSGEIKAGNIDDNQNGYANKLMNQQVIESKNSQSRQNEQNYQDQQAKQLKQQDYEKLLENYKQNEKKQNQIIVDLKNALEQKENDIRQILQNTQIIQQTNQDRYLQGGEQAYPLQNQKRETQMALIQEQLVTQEAKLRYQIIELSEKTVTHEKRSLELQRAIDLKNEECQCREREVNILRGELNEELKRREAYKLRDADRAQEINNLKEELKRKENVILKEEELKILECNRQREEFQHRENYLRQGGGQYRESIADLESRLRNSENRVLELLQTIADYKKEKESYQIRRTTNAQECTAELEELKLEIIEFNKEIQNMNNAFQDERNRLIQFYEGQLSKVKNNKGNIYNNSNNNWNNHYQTSLNLDKQQVLKNEEMKLQIGVTGGDIKKLGEENEQIISLPQVLLSSVKSTNEHSNNVKSMKDVEFEISAESCMHNQTFEETFEESKPHLAGGSNTTATDTTPLNTAANCKNVCEKDKGIESVKAEKNMSGLDEKQEDETIKSAGCTFLEYMNKLQQNANQIQSNH